ncbi:capsid assembly protein [Synechococcus phage S-SRP02]|nr:capsid assembly protein [Synechococcus phage S-SRP02]
MTATPQATDELQALIGPGQQDLFDEFVQEVEQQQAEIAAAEQQAQADDEQQLLAGKFKSTEELEKAYLEAQRLISQRGQQSQPQADEAPLSREEAIGYYGESIVTAAEEAGIDLGAWNKAVKRGDDTAEMRQKLSAQTGIPSQLIEQYEQAFRPNGQVQQPANEGLTDSDVSELKALVGGDQEFTRLSQWAVANLDANELTEYNAAVDSGNKSAVRFALRSLQLRASQGQPGEPELIGGGKPIRAEVFASQQEAIEAQRKTNSKGQNLYRVDPKYREWFERTLARSNFSA